jgi:ribosome-binding factor A
VGAAPAGAGLLRCAHAADQRMARNSSRIARIADQIQKDLAELIRTEVKDPRIGMITLTGVEVSNDYHHAKVFFTALGEPKAAELAMIGLERASGFLRSQLAAGLKLRIVPELHFVHDQSVVRGIELSRLIDDAIASQPPDPDKAED